jgi:hypothetical protein
LNNYKRPHFASSPHSKRVNVVAGCAARAAAPLTPLTPGMHFLARLAEQTADAKIDADQATNQEVV